MNPISRALPFPYAKRHGVLVIQHDEHHARLLCRAPVRASILAEVRRHLRAPIEVEVVENHPFEEALRRAYEANSGSAMESMIDLGEDTDLQRIADHLPEPEDLLDSREVLQPDRFLSPLLSSRIKVMARLDIAEKRLPQDGRISLRIAGRAVDVRVSTLPGAHGERVVLRLLDKQAGRLDLRQLGMAPDILTGIEGIIRKPHGIILVTGPTGSGKTTTLYSVLAKLNALTRNILTVEDPIEYYLDGIGQTQVNAKVDMSFARGLRAILRQDPDVVMVGEIRDLETARIAAQASLTGHLVLSTLHTNTAVSAATRLVDMGVEPFLLSSTLIAVLSQRLARRLCPHCKESYTPRADELGEVRSSDTSATRLYRPKGCERCEFTGYRGRSGLYELVIIDDKLRAMIHDRAPEHEMERYARQRTRSLHQDGIKQALAGDTSLEEILRVTRED
uniref:General secretion pathway protein E n=1 Tax=Candidatus Kentrum sp. LPFa TaxID=2126335 RepID=A0A450X180_9GAMM|nr:MAG: general secretion pathway protein E [Candidatus Kentron sp. LPFa]